ncbi:extracellular catalytic domain type 1 short-chain-length polyhydroxyalkanoate depolymerase [Amycolatopsis magusensis]|uniref:Poly(Hydroxyalkanoate) depolymerase family esterase n=1 Tax=Amycolatopsis magusensis TaxID=882444 RepID=A0ABS4PR02_9PSEU|nr:PHB depolymerase family esterase [Amycolatopsis magusensis]MBP2181855.1 poly(hydroxyalkanoate) depolymerase family esterase [Amycolatopsis magusensis]
MRTLTIALALLATLLTGVTPASAANIVEVTGFGSNPGALKMFRYLPDGLPAGRPIVVAMHGCTQDATGYGTGSGWRALADSGKFSVVLPQQQSGNNLNKCFNWFQAGDTTRGSGEAESIAQMVRRTQADTGGTSAYATGLSAGGGMTSVMLAAYPDLFAGGAVVAGLPYACAATMVEAFSCMNPGKDRTAAAWGSSVRSASPHQGPWPVVSLWQGTADYTVAAANQRELVEQWTNVHGVAATPSETDSVAGYPHATYRDGNGRAVVETYSLTGMGHGQPVDPPTCGTAGAYILDVNLCAAGKIAAFWGLV